MGEYAGQEDESGEAKKEARSDNASVGVDDRWGSMEGRSEKMMSGSKERSDGQ